jgi:16S rRNA (adenine1518-N6/adenine1519-N6)-dimethyltransferase
VRLVPHTQLPYVALDFELFANVVKQAFGMRRKTLRNALKNWVKPQIWEIVEIENNLRPEVLSVKDYVELANAISRH